MSTHDDIHAIEQLQRQFAQLNDEGQWDALAALFTEDAQFTRPSDPTRPIVGREAILQAFQARPKGTARCHLVANPSVELLSESHARASCYSVLLTAQELPQGTVTVGGFDDQLTRTATGWKFQSRVGFTLFDPVPFAGQAALERLLPR